MTTSPAQMFQAENRFHRRATLVLAGFAVAGFALFNLAGLTDISVMPGQTQLHAVVMVTWLALFVAQVLLGTSGKIAVHRKLGWAGAALAALAVTTGYAATHATMVAGRVPPVFPPGYFYLLGMVNLTLFGAFVASAIALRKRTDWHRRLMIGSLLMIYEPVLGRTLPFVVIPALGGPEAAFPAILENRGAFELFRVLVHLFILALIMWRDKAISGRVHPAYFWVLAALVFSYSSINTLGFAPPVVDYATSLMPPVVR